MSRNKKRRKTVEMLWGQVWDRVERRVCDEDFDKHDDIPWERVDILRGGPLQFMRKSIELQIETP